MITKRRARLYAGLLLAAAGLSANSGYSGAGGYAEASASQTRVDPAALTAVLPDATLKAQATFDRFLAGAIQQTTTGPASAVRIITTTVDGPPKRTWLFDVKPVDGGFAGVSAGASEMTSFTRDDVVDWSHATRDGRMHGNFAARAMMEVLPDHRAALIATTLAFDPLPTGW